MLTGYTAAEWHSTSRIECSAVLYSAQQWPGCCVHTLQLAMADQVSHVEPAAQADAVGTAAPGLSEAPPLSSRSC